MLGRFPPAIHIKKEPAGPVTRQLWGLYSSIQTVCAVAIKALEYKPIAKSDGRFGLNQKFE
jgi:hypothetical protein